MAKVIRIKIETEIVVNEFFRPMCALDCPHFRSDDGDECALFNEAIDEGNRCPKCMEATRGDKS